MSKSRYLELTAIKSATPFTPLGSGTSVLPRREERAGPCMRRLSDEEIAAERAERLGSVEHLTEAQMLAMMVMSADIRHQTIWHKERERFSAPPFTGSTFRALSELGLARWSDTLRKHVMTEAGHALAPAAADWLVTTNNIHAPVLGGSVRATVNFGCTCGWSCALVRGGDIQRKAMRAFSTHMNDVRARGTIGEMAASIVPRHVGEDDFNQDRDG